jgi:hypothetical protein
MTREEREGEELRVLPLGHNSVHSILNLPSVLLGVMCSVQ